MGEEGDLVICFQGRELAVWGWWGEGEDGLGLEASFCCHVLASEYWLCLRR